MNNADKTMDKIVALCKGRGYVYPGSEIYGGLANTWDYGPLGVEFKNNVKKAWWKKFIQESKYNVGLDCAILMNPETWVASGHVGGFSDPLMDCKECKSRHRADKLIEDFAHEKGEDITVDGWSKEKMVEYITENNIVCPKCGKQVAALKSEQPNIIINNSNENTNINHNQVGGYGRPKDKWISFFLCLFLGIFGGHKFYEGKIGAGILYLLTAGLCGVGVLVDLIILLFKPNPYYV